MMFAPSDEDGNIFAYVVLPETFKEYIFSDDLSPFSNETTSKAAEGFYLQHTGSKKNLGMPFILRGEHGILHLNSIYEPYGLPKGLFRAHSIHFQSNSGSQEIDGEKITFEADYVCPALAQAYMSGGIVDGSCSDGNLLHTACALNSRHKSTSIIGKEFRVEIERGRGYAHIFTDKGGAYFRIKDICTYSSDNVHVDAFIILPMGMRAPITLRLGREKSEDDVRKKGGVRA